MIEIQLNCSMQRSNQVAEQEQWWSCLVHMDQCFDVKDFGLRREDPMDKDTLPPTWENETGSCRALG